MAKNNPDQGNLAWYTAVLAVWQVKLCGPKPTNEQLTMAHAWGARAGKQALHIAMCLRPDGCTVRQFTTAMSSGPANNKRGEVVGRKLATQSKLNSSTGDLHGAYAFKLTPTALGTAAVKAYLTKLATVDAPPKVKGKATAPVKAAPKGNGNGNGKAAKKAAAPKGAGKPKGPRKPRPATPTPDAPQTAPAATPAPANATPPATQGDAPQGDGAQS